MRIRITIAASIAAVIVALVSDVGAVGGPGGVPSSGNGQPCLGVPPTAPDYSFKHDCATPTPTPNPSINPNPPSTPNIGFPPPYFETLAAVKTKGGQFATDAIWQSAFVDDYDTVPSSDSYSTWRTNNNTVSTINGWYAPFMSLRMYDENCPANEGAVCRQPIYDQREQDFIHVDDPANLSGRPTSQATSGTSAGCTWFWNADARGEQGGYAIYNRKNDITPIATVGTGVTSYTELGLTNGITYYRYIDSILVTDTLDTAVGTTGVAVIVTVHDVNTNILAHTRLHVADGTSSEDVEVIASPAPFVMSSHTKYWAVYNHTHPSGLTITNQAAYSGVDSLDSTTTAMTNTTQPNLGTRLPGDSVGNAAGDVIANCTPLVAANSTPVLAHSVITQQPTPYPLAPGPYPTASAPIAMGGSVDEVANPQVTPGMQYYNNTGGGAAPAPVVTIAPTAWLSASCGTDCLTWTIINAPSTPSKAENPGAYGPLDMQFFAPNPSPVTFGPWGNYAKNNRSVNPTYATTNAATETSCSHQMAIDHEDLLDDLVAYDLGNPSQQNNTITSEEIAKDQSTKNFDITHTHDSYLLTPQQMAACSQLQEGATLQAYMLLPLASHLGSYSTTASTPAWNSTWDIQWNDGYWVNFGHNPAGNNLLCGSGCDYNSSPATQQRFFDGSFCPSGAFPTADEWEGEITTVLEDAQRSPPVFDVLAEGNGPNSNCSPSGSNIPDAVYWVRANADLVTQYPNGIFMPPSVVSIDFPYDSTNHWMPIYEVEYSPLGFPLNPLTPLNPPIPMGTNLPQKLTDTALFNATDQLFERWFTNGVVLVCPNNTTVSNCKFHTFPQTVYLLNPDDGDINGNIFGCNATLGHCLRTYTAETTTGTMASNTAQIILFSPQ